MANWCSNSVVFVADDEKSKAIYTLFSDIQLKQKQDGRYHLPDFAKDERGVMTDIEMDDRHITYESRWVPNLQLLMEIADYYGAGFVSRFEEMQNGVIGEARYEAGVLTVAGLYEEQYHGVCEDFVRSGNSPGERFFRKEGDLLDYILSVQELSDQFVRVYPRNNGPEYGY